jgi:hypothetical protein
MSVRPPEDMTFDEAVAADTLGVLLPEQLPEIATEALCTGLDSPSLAALAGESPRAASPHELHLLFERVLRELEVDRPTPVRAAEILRDYSARRVVSGEVSPHFGAEAIVRGVLDRVRDDLPPGEYLGSGLGITRLVGLFYDYDLVHHEGLGTEEEVNNAVVEECRRILEEPAA